MTPEEMRERAVKIATLRSKVSRDGGVINACREIAADIAAIPIPPTPPDPSAEALKLAETALHCAKPYVTSEPLSRRGGTWQFVLARIDEALAAIGKITGGAE